MLFYEQVSTKVFSIYMKYVSPEDIHVYSIDECFLDVTGYLKTYGMSARDLAMTMIRENVPLSLLRLGGGGDCTVGIMRFALRRKGAHGVWHFIVLFGAVVNWFGIYLFLY